MDNNKYLYWVMEQLQFPQEAQVTLRNAGDLLLKDSKRETQIQYYIEKYFQDTTSDEGKIFKSLEPLALSCEVHPYEASMVFLLYCAQGLQKKYKDEGYSESLFWNMAIDFKCKLMECWKVKEVWGTFVPTWYASFFAMKRFGIGRFQYEFQPFLEKTYTAGGITINEGDRVISFHIPSSGPLTDDVRFDSYKRAYAFYKNDFKDKVVPIVCHSWLLYGEHKNFLPKNSNILAFMNDFDLLRSTDQDTFTNGWRIFDNQADKPPSELPRKTSLQRAYADRLMAGKKTGSGYGIFLFDGEKRL